MVPEYHSPPRVAGVAWKSRTEEAPPQRFDLLSRSVGIGPEASAWRRLWSCCRSDPCREKAPKWLPDGEGSPSEEAPTHPKHAPAHREEEEGTRTCEIKCRERSQKEHGTLSESNSEFRPAITGTTAISCNSLEARDSDGIPSGECHHSSQDKERGERQRAGCYGSDARFPEISERGPEREYSRIQAFGKLKTHK